MCLCDEGQVRSACLPDDLRDSMTTKDDGHRALSSTPDRFEKQPSSAGNDGRVGSGGLVGGDSNENAGNGNGKNDGGGGGSSSSIGGRVIATTTVGSLTATSRNGCKYPCLNGGTCQGTVCSCRQGYSGENCAEREY